MASLALGTLHYLADFTRFTRDVKILSPYHMVYDVICDASGSKILHAKRFALWTSPLCLIPEQFA